MSTQLERDVERLLYLLEGSDRTVCVCDTLLPRAGRHRCGGLVDQVAAHARYLQDMDRRIAALEPPLPAYEDDFA